MFRVVPKKQKKFDINSKLLLEMTWKKHHVWRTHEEQTDVMVSWVGIKIAHLVSQLTITKIMSNSEDNRSFFDEVHRNRVL